jgi:DNA-binding protein WhiA
MEEKQESRSFASKVRTELAEHISKGRHCRKAELRAFFEGCHSEKPFSILSEGLTIPEKCYSLLKKAYRVEPVLDRVEHENRVTVPSGGSRIAEDLMRDDILERECCKRAYLRGWFLAAGTVTDPEGHYQLEIVTKDESRAFFINEILKAFDIEGKITKRKGNSVLYLKEGQKVADFLGLIGATVALMEYENARIVKEVRGRINRQVNCETANIKKTINASARQVEQIEYIRETIGFDQLSDSLAQIAKMRLEYPDVSLKELGEMMDPPLGKSAVNHRLRRLSELAADMDGQS